jgi:hypothetical protein
MVACPGKANLPSTPFHKLPVNNPDEKLLSLVLLGRHFRLDAAGLVKKNQRFAAQVLFLRDGLPAKTAQKQHKKISLFFVLALNTILISVSSTLFFSFT